MAEIADRNRLDEEERLFEEEFLLACQCEIQRLMNAKGLRYRDLSRRLNVSEARVSQMLGDDAVNLTIRTVARIFDRLDEAPVLITRREYDRLNAGRDRSDGPADGAWTMVVGDVSRFAATCVQLVDEGDGAAPVDGRLSRPSDWLRAEPLLACRTG